MVCVRCTNQNRPLFICVRGLLSVGLTLLFGNLRYHYQELPRLVIGYPCITRDTTKIVSCDCCLFREVAY